MSIELGTLNGTRYQLSDGWVRMLTIDKLQEQGYQCWEVLAPYDEWTRTEEGRALTAPQIKEAPDAT
jgi:hypothetical protein